MSLILSAEPEIENGKVDISNEEVLKHILRQEIERTDRENDFRSFDNLLYDHFKKAGPNTTKFTTAQKKAISFCKFVDGKLYRQFEEHEVKTPTGIIKEGYDINKVKSMNVL
jgi:hypothetical protein